MKRFITLLLVIVISLPALAQQSKSFFEQMTDKYSEQDGFSASMLTKDMFDLYLKKKNVDESSEMSAALKNLDNILVISQGKYEFGYLVETGEKRSKQPKTEVENVHKDILEHYKENDYTLLKTEKRMGEDVKVYIKKNREKITSLALVTNSNAATNLVELHGDIDLANVSSLSKAMNLRGLENLYKIENSNHAFWGSTGYTVMPDERVEEMVARQREMYEKQREFTDKQREEIEKQAQIQTQKQLEMAEKYRQMAETYGRQPLFLKAPGDTNTVYYIDGKKIDRKDIKKELEKLNHDEIKTTEVTREDGKKGEEGKTVIKITTKK